MLQVWQSWISRLCLLVCYRMLCAILIRSTCRLLQRGWLSPTLWAPLTSERIGRTGRCPIYTTVPCVGGASRTLVTWNVTSVSCTWDRRISDVLAVMPARPTRIWSVTSWIVDSWPSWDTEMTNSRKKKTWTKLVQYKIFKVTNGSGMNIYDMHNILSS